MAEAESRPPRRGAVRALLALLGVLLVVVLAPLNARADTPSSAPSATSATFGIGPSDGKKTDGRAFFNFLSSPGGQLADHVAVQNLSAQPLALRVYATDAVNSADGSISYLPGSAKPKDAGSWLALATPTATGMVSIPAGASEILPFTLKVPASASPGDHVGAIIVSLTSRIKNSKGQDENFEQRVATKVYVRVSGTIVARLGIDSLHASYSTGLVLNPFGTGDVSLTYRVRNTGNVILGGTQAVEVSGWYGGTKRASSLATIPALLPGAATTVTTTVHGVAPGFELSVKARVQPVPPVNAVDPALVIASASTSVLVVPWLPLLVLVLIIGGAVGLVWWRRSRTKKHRHSRHRPLASSRH